jgi:hypothetical protein
MKDSGRALSSLKTNEIENGSGKGSEYFAWEMNRSFNPFMSQSICCLTLDV